MLASGLHILSVRGDRPKNLFRARSEAGGGAIILKGERGNWREWFYDFISSSGKQRSFGTPEKT